MNIECVFSAVELKYFCRHFDVSPASLVSTVVHSFVKTYLLTIGYDGNKVENLSWHVFSLLDRSGINQNKQFFQGQRGGAELNECC